MNGFGNFTFTLDTVEDYFLLEQNMYKQLTATPANFLNN